LVKVFNNISLNAEAIELKGKMMKMKSPSHILGFRAEILRHYMHCFERFRVKCMQSLQYRYPLVTSCSRRTVEVSVSHFVN